MGFLILALMKKILFSFIITSFLSCKTTRIYNESSNNVPNIIKEYIENDNPLKNNFLLQESTIDSINYKPILSEPYWVVPSKNILEIIDIQKSNNNVSIAIYNNKIYLAFRTGPTHFASKKTGIYIVSSNDAINWKEEMSIFIKILTQLWDTKWNLMRFLVLEPLGSSILKKMKKKCIFPLTIPPRYVIFII